MGSNEYFFILVIFINLSLLCTRLKNVLLMLFAFEFMMLNMFLMFLYLSIPYEFSSLLVFLAMVAGEASLGLSMLVAMLRKSGSDMSSGSDIFSLSDGF